MLTERVERSDGGASCQACADELARWADGGHHLTCRTCELGVATGAVGERAAFYARLAQLAQVAAPKHRVANLPNLSAPA